MLQENDVAPLAIKPPIVSSSCEEQQKKPLFHALGELTENEKALLFFSGKVTIQNFNSSI